MKVFISWSGPKSKAVAIALHAWIPRVIQEARTFMSADSIESGQRWSGAIAEELEGTNFGIICTTAGNQFAPWLNFEAGALAKKLAEARVAPLAIDLAPSDIKPPLGQFNGDPLTEDGIRKLLHSMNAAADSPVPLTVLDPNIDLLWPVLEAAVEHLPEDGEGVELVPERKDREILSEVLDTVRELARAQRNTRRVLDHSEEWLLSTSSEFSAQHAAMARSQLRAQIERQLVEGALDPGIEKSFVNLLLLLDAAAFDTPLRVSDKESRARRAPQAHGDRSTEADILQEAQFENGDG